jgi:glycolate dehydrogenase FAD-linked subunit
MTAPERLFADLPPDRVVTDPDVLAAYSRDDAAWAEAGKSIALVRPTSTAEVAAVVTACAAAGVPIVPRGAGTGLSGGANAVDGGVILSLERMDAIVEINTAERLAVVQAGVVNDHLRAAAAEHGLWYPPDPGSAPWSTIGGNVATNAGGLCCVKYGVTRDYVLALEVVTAAGEVVRVGRRTAKGVAGYDLAGLMVGSEGTLGVITEVTVRLRPLRTAPMRTVVGFFDTLSEAGDAVARVTAAGLQPAAFELIDRACLRAVNAWKNMGLPEEAAALLLAQTDLPEPAAEQEAVAIHDCFVAAGASDAMVSTDPVEAEALFDARRLAGPALLWEHEDAVLTEDVCLPRGKLAEMLALIEKIAATHNIPIATIAHAGDGNLHPCLVTPKGDLDGRDRALAAFQAIIDAAIDMGGTVTGEHGVGLLKRAGMQREVGPVGLAMQRAIKGALDPRGILNPGKVIG